ncbi:MAG: acyl carrier protein [Blautia sp.]|nr:acyl carrier protein [Eubacteriales bacterium]MED9966040.1 acyl carrier protein [Blautia sp.]
MNDKLMNILNELRPELDFEKENRLIEDGILDSFDLVSLIGEINDQFDVEIDFDDIEPENFNSAEAMIKLIERLKEE